MSQVRLLVSLSLLSTFAPAAAAENSSGGSSRPNVLLIIADDLSAEALGCYGSEQARTPHVDRLAASGMLFTRAFCQFPICGPSRAALMSGLYPQQNGVVGNGSSEKLAAVLGDRPTLAQYFRRQGYYSARVSKIYHMRVPGDITAGVDGPDHTASWDERFNCQAPEWMTRGNAEHLSNERLRFDPDGHYRLGFGGAFFVVEGEGDGSEQADHLAATKAVEILETRARHDEPFFLAVGLVRPHVPLVAPRLYFDPFPAEEIRLYDNPDDDISDIPQRGRNGSSRARGLADQPEKQRRVLRGYHASVAFMDAQVGRILSALDETGLAGSTIVVFKSDHGYHLGEHDLWQKMSLHEESSRIPLLVRAPGRQPGECASLVEAIDLYPTLAELAGLGVPEHCVGNSMVPLFDDPSTTVRSEVYCTRGDADLLRTERWAYIRYHEGRGEELYDMQNDPSQFTNLAGKERTAEVLTEMRTRLDRKLESF